MAEINSPLLRERVNLAPIAASGVVGAAAATVDIVSNIGVSASAANLAFTLPNPTDTRSGRSVIVTNTGTNTFTMYANSVKAGQYIELIWGAEDNTWHTPSEAPVAANAFDNDLGLGADGKIETGFPLHRDTFTTGAFYREWSNNRTGVTGTGAGLVYGLNNYGLGSGYWDKALIGQGSATIGYYNSVLAPYSGAVGQENIVAGYTAFAAGLRNDISGGYNSAFGNTNKSNQAYTMTTGVLNVNNGGNSFVSGSSNTNTSTSSGVIGYSNDTAGAYNFAAGYVNKITSNYAQTLGANNQVIGGGYTLAQGYNNITTGSYSFVGGLNNGTAAAPITGTGTITYGNGHVQSANYSAQFGLIGTMAGSYNIGAGYNTRVRGSYNAAFGYNSDLSAGSFGNLVGGYSHVVTGERGIIGGNGHTYAGQYGATFGSGNTIAAGVYGTQTTGSNNQANGSWNSFIAGEGNRVDAGGLYTKIVGGYFNTVTTNTHVVFALGQSNTIGSATGLLTNSGSGAIGNSNTVTGAGSVAIGQGNTIAGGTSYVLGLNYSVTGANQVGIAGAGQSLGFYGKAPIPKQTLPAAATNAATTQALVNALRTALINLGLAQ